MGRRRRRCGRPRDRDPRAGPRVRPRPRRRQPRGHERAGPEGAAPARAGRRCADPAADPRRCADAPRPARPTSRSRWPASRSTTWRTATATSGSRCCPTGSTPRPSTFPATTSSSRRPRPPIDRLNERHGEAPGGGARFLLFHRNRSAGTRAEGCWMGWERKRGKLHELNALLRGSTTTGILTTGRAAFAPPTACVTCSPSTPTRGCRVARSAGWSGRSPIRSTEPSFDARGGPGDRRVRGPPASDHLDAPGRARRVALPAGLLGTGRHRSVRVRGLRRLPGPVRRGKLTPARGSTTSTPSSAAMADRVPENALLSHDLFEGVFARAGLVTDVELFDEFPSNYLVLAARQHRWARGDWQLLPWILGRARDATGRRRRNTLPAIGRWKMIDNLRRTLSAPLTLATLVAAWTAPGGLGRRPGPCSCSRSIVIPPGLPVVGGTAATTAGHLEAEPPARRGRGPRPGRRPRRRSGSRSWPTRRGSWATRSCGPSSRLYVTRRNLLEWTTAAQAKAEPRPRPRAASTGGWPAPSSSRSRPASSSLAVKPEAAWIAAPFVRPVADLAVRRPLGQPAARRCRPRSSCRRRTSSRSA